MSRTNPRYRRVNPIGTAVGSTYGVIRYKIIGSIENQLTVSVFDYFSTNPAPTVAQLNTLLTNTSAAVFAAYKACVSADWSCTMETIAVVHVNNILGYTSTARAGQVGGRSTGHLPTEVAQPIIKVTSLKGQHGRGRLSLPAIAIADVTGSKITAVAETGAIASLGAAMLTEPTDGTNSWLACVSMRSTSSPKLVSNFAPLITTNMSPLLGTIRRRKIGRGK